LNGKESKREVVVREALEAALEPGELLLAYTNGNHYASMNQPFHIGLTERRLLLVSASRRGRRAGQRFSIFHEAIQWVSWNPMNPLTIQLPADRMVVRVPRSWRKRTEGLVEAYDPESRPSNPGEGLTAEQQMQQTRDLQALGFLASAQHQFDEAVRRNPVLLTSSGEVAAMEEDLAESRLAMRVAAIFLFVGVAVSLCLNVLSLATADPEAASGTTLSLISIAIDIGIGASLWRGRTRWKVWAIWRAALGLLIYGGQALGAGLFVEALLEAAFSGALLLVLTGRSTRTRTVIAGGIYAVGFLLLPLVSLLYAIFLGAAGL
jgi:hypothetical protein